VDASTAYTPEEMAEYENRKVTAKRGRKVERKTKSRRLGESSKAAVLPPPLLARIGPSKAKGVPPLVARIEGSPNPVPLVARIGGIPSKSTNRRKTKGSAKGVTM
jgi:hypothetical protein